MAVGASPQATPLSAGQSIAQEIDNGMILIRTGQIFEQVDAAIQAVSKEKGLDIVLRSNIGASQPLILYVNEDKIVDITLDVARKLGLDVSEAEQTSSN